MKLFPDDDRKGRILCHALTADFLYYGTDVRLSLGCKLSLSSKIKEGLILKYEAYNIFFSSCHHRLLLTFIEKKTSEICESECLLNVSVLWIEEVCSTVPPPLNPLI